MLLTAKLNLMSGMVIGAAARNGHEAGVQT